MFIIIVQNAVLPARGEGRGSPVEPKTRHLLWERKKRASQSNKNFLQMWSLKESRESKLIFSRSKRANCNRRHGLLSLTFGSKQHFHIET